MSLTIRYPTMTVREEQVALTRRMIVDAFVELSAVPDARPVTVAEVARHSGVSPATIYRHFPNRDALLWASANRDNHLTTEQPPEEWDMNDLRQHMLALWGRLAEDIVVTREATVSEAGREMRLVRWEATRNDFQRMAKEGGLDPDSPRGRHFVAAASVMISAHAFLDMYDRQGLTVEEAVETACSAIELLAEASGIAAYRPKDSTDRRADRVSGGTK
jgi:AcrR family transcriptional regulator